MDDAGSAPISRAKSIAEADHFGELVAGVDVEEREGDVAGIEGLLRQAQHHRGVLADGVEHHRVPELGRDFAQDVDALGLEQLQVAEVGDGVLRVRVIECGHGLTVSIRLQLEAKENPQSRCWRWAA